jgi:hypothetical protein
MNSTWKRALRGLCLVGWRAWRSRRPAPCRYQSADRLDKLLGGARPEGPVPVTTPLDPQDPGPLVVAAAAFAPHRQYVAHRFTPHHRLQHPTGKTGPGAASSAVGSTPNRFADPLIDPAIAQGRADRLNRCGRVVSQKTNGAQSGLK